MGAITIWLAAVVGCTWVTEPAACEYPVYDWSDDLLGYMELGGGDAFSLDPVDAPRDRITGVYNFENGNFDHEVLYAADYWLTSTRSRGYGTVWHNGDLDLLYSSEVEDTEDEDWKTWTRLERSGCRVELTSWADGAEDAATTIVGRYTDADTLAFEWDTSGFSFERVQTSALDVTETGEEEGGNWSYESTFSAADGTTVSETETVTGDVVTTTEFEQAFDGDWDVRIDVQISGEDAYTVRCEAGYDGDGTRTVRDGDEVVCEEELSGVSVGECATGREC